MRIPISIPLWIKTLPQSPLGPISAVVSDQGLCRVAFCSAPEMQDELGDHLVPENTSASRLLKEICSQLESYLDGQLRWFTVPLDWRYHTPFQEKVLQAAMRIPYGQVRTYAQLAELAGKPKAARAIGGAMASNPLPLVIPCHRVVAANGHLHGYSGRGGLETKAWLLQMEGIQIVNQRLG
ncbi:MAG: methylated-DNA--[protein]-cysteine S-methyltransferase [Anaerolineaceae bacterium]|nr:methylated-DNA--[protein]-cysteine S-methyltransferase [Anaerolineaceae bacterium]